MKSTPDKLITVPIYDLVHGLLGYGYWEKRAIPKHMAEIIYQHLKNDNIAHIQFEDEETLEELAYPILWDISFWRASVESWKRSRAYSDREREKREIAYYNVRILTPFLASLMGMDVDKCRDKAQQIVRAGKFKQMEMLGFTGKFAVEFKDIQ